MKKYIKFVFLILVSVLLTIKLPYTNEHIAQVFIPPIYLGSGNMILYLSGILNLLVAYLVAKQFKDIWPKVKISTFLLMILFLILISFLKIDQHIEKNMFREADGASSIMITDNYINLYKDNDKLFLNTSIDVNVFKQSMKPVSIYIEVPENLRNDLKRERILLEDKVFFYYYKTEKRDYSIDLSSYYPSANLDIKEVRESFLKYNIIFKVDNDESKWRLRK